MPIRNSKVPSAEVFSIQRKKRLPRGRGQGTDATDRPVEQADEAPPREVSDPPQRPDHPMEVPAAASCGRGDAPSAAGATTSLGTEPRSAEDKVSRTRQTRSVKAAPDKEEADDRVRLNVKLPYPATGSSPTFDHLVESQGEKGAFRLVLTKALELYAASAVEGTLADAPKKYPESENIARTTRGFSREAYDVLEGQVNPTGLLSDRAVGIAIARRALAAFIASDKDFV